MQKLKPKRAPLAPSPYGLIERTNGCHVTRMVHEVNPEADNSYFSSYETDSIHTRHYDAIARIAELNGPPAPMHPLDALLHLFAMATQERHSGAEVGARVLLGLYNGYRFPLDLTELRRLDSTNHQACMTAIQFDTPCQYEVHEWLNIITGRTDMGERFEWMAYDYKMDETKPEWERPEPLALASPLRD